MGLEWFGLVGLTRLDRPCVEPSMRWCETVVAAKATQQDNSSLLPSRGQNGSFY